MLSSEEPKGCQKVIAEAPILTSSLRAISPCSYVAVYGKVFPSVAKTRQDSED